MDKSLLREFFILLNWKVYHDTERAQNMFQRFDKVKTNAVNSMFGMEEFGRVTLKTLGHGENH